MKYLNKFSDIHETFGRKKTVNPKTIKVDKAVERLGPAPMNWNFSDVIRGKMDKSKSSTQEPTKELMKVIKPYFDENGLEKTKEYLSNILDNFDYEDFIGYYYGKK